MAAATLSYSCFQRYKIFGWLPVFVLINVHLSTTMWPAKRSEDFISSTTQKKQIVTLQPTTYCKPDSDFILPRVIELTYTTYDLRPFAEDMGFNGPPFTWDLERRAQLRADLDAYYARLYGLTRDELRSFRGLKNNRLRNYGEYRTQRLVLEAWDALEKVYGR